MCSGSVNYLVVTLVDRKGIAITTNRRRDKVKTCKYANFCMLPKSDLKSSNFINFFALFSAKQEHPGAKVCPMKVYGYRKRVQGA